MLRGGSAAARKAGYEPGECNRLSFELFSRGEILGELSRAQKFLPENMREKVVAGLERLSFGGQETIEVGGDGSPGTWEVDLFHVSELKLLHSGELGLKFSDRLRTLEMLYFLSLEDGGQRNPGETRTPKSRETPDSVGSGSFSTDSPVEC